MTVLDEIKFIQDAAIREASGDPTAHVELLSGIQKLQVAATTPTEKMLRIRFAPYQNVCIRIAQERQLLHALVERTGKMTAAELATETQTDELLISK